MLSSNFENTKLPLHCPSSFILPKIEKTKLCPNASKIKRRQVKTKLPELNPMKKSTPKNPCPSICIENETYPEANITDDEKWLIEGLPMDWGKQKNIPSAICKFFNFSSSKQRAFKSYSQAEK